MKTEEELQQDILSIILKIQQEYPELLKYLSERPVEFPENNGDGVKRKSLEAYYNSLKELLKGYSKVHLKKSKI